LEQPTEANKGVRGAANRGRGAGSSNHRVGGNVHQLATVTKVEAVSEAVTKVEATSNE